MMKINIGSKNPQKVNAVKEILQIYPDLATAEVNGIGTNSNVSDQPISLDETIQGAINRAKGAFVDCSLSIGLESGLMEVPQTKTGFMDVTACAIFDGKNIHLGLSSAFEYPIKVTESVFKDNLNISESFIKNGLTTDSKLGSNEGAVGYLTKGRLDRKEYTKQALITALIHLENKELY